MKTQSSLKQQTNAALIIQKWYRGHKARLNSKELAKMFYKRKKILEQLVQTQENYIRDIGIIITDFKMKLVGDNTISITDCYTIFSNLDAIRRLNEDYFATIYNHFENYSNYKIIFADVYKQVYFFKIYFQYLNNFTLSCSKIQQLKKSNAKFKTFVANIRKNPKYGFLDLQDYVVKPVQRLPKYVLLMKQLKRKTPQNHPDYQNIDKVLHCFQEVNFSNNDKLNKVLNNFKLSQLQKTARLPFHITQPGIQFILQQSVSILTRSNKIIDATLYLLNTMIVITQKNKSQIKFIQNVPFKYGASIMENEDHELYKHSFTVQGIEGQSTTFVCQNEEQKFVLLQKIQKQILVSQKKNMEKLQALFQNNKTSESFIKNMNRFDLIPQVNILGTQQRSDHMFKYTTYIIQVKIKNIKQKIFMRFSQILAIQALINIQFPQMTIKQNLMKDNWLLNHKPKTIQQRKMSMQRFLKQILSKKQMIQRGSNVLMKLGLSKDFYSLPNRFKQTQSILKKSTLSQRSTQSNQQKKQKRGKKNYRLSIFQDLSDNQQKNQRQNSHNISLKASTAKKKLTIHQILQANEINLGHYTRYSQQIDQEQKQEVILDIYLPYIQSSTGLRKVKLNIDKHQRISTLINKLTKFIKLDYYKDFRLFLERDYAQRVLDDDQILYKVQRQLLTGKYHLIFKKMIYIDQSLEQKEIKSDRVRLKLIASQIIYQIKKAKYILDYSKFLLLSVLIGLIQHESKLGKAWGTQNDNMSQNSCSVSMKQIKSEQPNFQKLAYRTRKILANQYTSFFQNDKIWVKDYMSTYKTLYIKLNKIATGNSTFIRSSLIYDEQEQFNWTNIVQLAYISILDEMKTNELFGSMCYVVQISTEFRKIIEQLLKIDTETIKQILQNRNNWLVVKLNKVYLFTIDLQFKLFQIDYFQIDKLTCYPNSILIDLKNREIDQLKLKTTNSFSIRQILLYYKNYREMSKKIENDFQYTQSIIQMVRQHEKDENSFLKEENQEQSFYMEQLNHNNQQNEKNQNQIIKSQPNLAKKKSQYVYILEKEQEIFN